MLKLGYSSQEYNNQGVERNCKWWESGQMGKNVFFLTFFSVPNLRLDIG